MREGSESERGPLQRGCPAKPTYPIRSSRTARAKPCAATTDSTEFVSAEKEKAQLRFAVKETTTKSRRHANAAVAAMENWSRINLNLNQDDIQVKSDKEMLRWEMHGVHAGKNMLQVLTDSVEQRKKMLGEHHPATKRAKEKLTTHLSLSAEQREQAEKDAKERQKQKKMDKGFTEGRVGMAYELTAEEKESRSHAAILVTLRSVIKAKRSLNGKKIKNIKSLFHIIDTDDSMTVDMVEFTHALTRLGLGLSEDAVSRLGKALDTDGECDRMCCCDVPLVFRLICSSFCVFRWRDDRLRGV